MSNKMNPTVKPNKKLLKPKTRRKKVLKKSEQRMRRTKVEKKKEELDLSSDEWKVARRHFRKEKKMKYGDYPWFWGMINRKEAEDFLKGGVDGLFMVRSELNEDSTVLFISVCQGSDKFQKVLHFGACTKGPYWKLHSTSKFHRTIVKMVEYFQRYPIGKTGCQLKKAAESPNWIIKRRDILAPKNGICLGFGNFSEVAVGAYQRRLVAIKKLTSSGSQLQKDRDNLMREAMIMNELEHPHITRMVGISLNKLPPMLLLEMMAMSLEHHLFQHGSKITIGEKVLYFWQIASAMKYLTQKSIVHRDLASRNILISYYGILKLSDFGLADNVKNLKQVYIKHSPLPFSSMPPETIAKNVDFNEKTDVWAFAVTCNEILQNGIKPLLHINRENVMRKIKDYEGKYELHRISKTVPKDIGDLLNQCWSFKQSKRPTFSHIYDLLEMFVKVKYPPPEPEDQSVALIKNCKPLTMAEYKTLYEMNEDVTPLVPKIDMNRKEFKDMKRKIKKKIKEDKEARNIRVEEMKKKMEELKKKEMEELEKNKTMKKAAEEQISRAQAGEDEPLTAKTLSKTGTPATKEKILKDPVKRLFRMEKRYKRRRKRKMIRHKLAIWRLRRREELKRKIVLDELREGRNNDKMIHECQKIIRPNYVALVDIYRKLMRLKWRKIEPTRESVRRLRTNRVINSKSKHPMSRNGRAVRVFHLRLARIRRPKLKPPVFSNIPKLEYSQEKKIKANVVSSLNPKFKNLKNKPPEAMKRLMRKFERYVKRSEKKKERHKKNRMSRGLLRRIKIRRRYRRMRRFEQKDEMTWQQLDRMCELKFRRKERQRRLNRRHRSIRIGRILQDWVEVRKNLDLEVLKKMFKMKQKVMKVQIERNDKKVEKTAAEPSKEEKTANPGNVRKKKTSKQT